MERGGERGETKVCCVREGELTQERKSGIKKTGGASRGRKKTEDREREGWRDWQREEDNERRVERLEEGKESGKRWK